jgi:hypothetical protein
MRVSEYRKLSRRCISASTGLDNAMRICAIGSIACVGVVLPALPGERRRSKAIQLCLRTGPAPATACLC